MAALFARARRLVSTSLVALLIIGAGPGSFMVVPSTALAAGLQNVSTFAELQAALADDTVTEIVLTANIVSTSQITVSRPVTIDGDGFSITVGTDLGTVNGSKHALALVPEPTGGAIVLEDLAVDSASKAYGVSTYANAQVTLNQVVLTNSKGAGLTINGSSVTATALSTAGNAWGAVNVDPGLGVTTPSVFTFVSGSMAETNKVWSDGKNVTPTATVEVTITAEGFEEVETGTGLRLWTVPRTVQISDAAQLIAAIRDLRPADTLVLAAGTYDVERLLGNMTVGGQAGWYLPVWQPGVTLVGAGADATKLTSSVVSANGAWASQDFISVWANNVTIEGLTVVSKLDANKAIEVMGKNFVLRDVKLATNPNQRYEDEYYEFSGSLYFNPQVSVTGVAGDVGESRIESVSIESAWLSAPASGVTTGTISLRDLTIDWVGGGYASTPGYGMMSKNPVIVVESDVCLVVDDTMDDVAVQAASRMPAGASLVYRAPQGPSEEIPSSLFSSLQSGGEYPDGGALSFTYESPTTPGVYPYTWTFPIGTLDPSFDTTFSSGVTVRVTPVTPLEDMQADGLPDDGRVVAELEFAQSGALPGPGTVEILIGAAYAGLEFELVQYDGELGETVDLVTVDERGYVTLSVETGDIWYLIQAELEKNFWRVGGVDRYEVALNAAGELFPDWTGVTSVVIASGENRAAPDALTAAGLAGALEAPMLLSRWGVLDPRLEAALADMPEGIDVILVGGENSISPTVATAIGSLDNVGSVVRVDGADRYEVASNVAYGMEEILGEALPTTVLITNGNISTALFDALTASAISANMHFPVLLVRNDAVPAVTAETLEDLQLSERYIIGGPKSVSEQVRGSLGVVPADRLSGADRYEVAQNVAERALAEGWAETANPGVASALPDAACGGAFMGMQGGVMLYVRPFGIPAPTSDFITENAASIGEGWVFGGPVSVPESIRLELQDSIE